jgi:hypothetical protein
MLFVIDNENKFYSGLEVHGLNTRRKNQLNLSISNLSVFQKGTMFTGIRLLIDFLGPLKVFERTESVLKNNFISYLMNNSFYTVAEFLEHTANN